MLTGGVRSPVPSSSAFPFRVTRVTVYVWRTFRSGSASDVI